MKKAFRVITVVGVICLAAGIVISAIGFGIGLLTNKNEKTENFSKVITGNVEKIEIEINAGQLNIKKGSEFKVVAEDFPENTLKYECESGKLKIKEENKKWFGISYGMMGWNARTPVLTVYITEGMSFEDVSIDVGAGAADINYIKADKLKIQGGAGRISGEYLTAADCEISAGAGEVSLKNIDFSKSELSTGTGRLAVSGKITGATKLNNGIGEIEVTISGNKSDYYIKAQNGIGKISVNGKRYDKDDYNSGAQNTIDASNGIGAINIYIE